MWDEGTDSAAGRQAAVAEGLLHGTPVATPSGWRPVESLSPGDLVLTFEDGPVPLIEVWSQPLPTGQGLSAQVHWPFAIPAGALENRVPLVLLPEQRVLIESDAAEDLYGDPFALIPAAALQGYRGIDLTRPEPVAIAVRLGFSRDQIIYAGRGALIACPSPDLAGAGDVEAQAERAEYPTLSLAEARHLVACLMAEDIGAALRPLPQAGLEPEDQAARS